MALNNDTYSLPSLQLIARMLDYATMKYIYAIEMAEFWKTLGQKPSRRLH